MSEALSPSAGRDGGPILALSGVSSGYGPVSVVRNVSFAIGRGEIMVLLGKNGMGKTTLIKTIFGLIRPREGSIRIDGAPVEGLPPAALAALGVAYAPQDQPLFQELSVRDNLRLALPGDRRLGEALERVRALFPFLADRLAQKAGTLSGGEQKMLILARALMRKPRLLLVDEISEGLQPSVVDRIAAILKRERETAGVSMLVVEQSLDFALRMADRWAVLKLGEIDDEGPNGPDARARVLQHLQL